MWSLVVAFVVGLAIGVVGCRLAMGRGSTAAALPPAAPIEPEPAAPSTPPEPAAEVAATEAAPAEAATEAPAGGAPAETAPAEAASEVPASAVDDVVAELERRVKGRRTEGEADRTTVRRRGD